MAKSKKLGRLHGEYFYFFPPENGEFGTEKSYISDGWSYELSTPAQARKFVKNLRKLADGIEAVVDQVGKKK